MFQNDKNEKFENEPKDKFLEAKQNAGQRAAEHVKDQMKVGLGTGSTVHWTIVALAQRAKEGLSILCTATSFQTEKLATELGLTLQNLDTIGKLDIAIDGADEVDDSFNCVKGGGGAHTREKIVAAQADQFVVVVDESKLVTNLGAFGVPLEILDFAPQTVIKSLHALGATRIEEKSSRSDNGNLLLSAFFPPILDPGKLAQQLSAIPGIVEHGIFLESMVTSVIVAGENGIVEKINPLASSATNQPTSIA